MIKPKPQFAKPHTGLKRTPQPANYDREERAAIHEHEGGLSREEAEALADAECQHCAKQEPLRDIHRASYGHALRVCAECEAELTAKGWVAGTGEERF